MISFEKDLSLPEEPNTVSYLTVSYRGDSVYYLENIGPPPPLHPGTARANSRRWRVQNSEHVHGARSSRGHADDWQPVVDRRARGDRTSYYACIGPSGVFKLYTLVAWSVAQFPPL